MSSRLNFIGSAPKSGIYDAKPVPAEAEDLPTYINDELLNLGGILNGVLEGGAFPPQSELPKRVRDGMMIYFTQPIKGSTVTSAGVWLYRRNQWWKLIDDPTSIVGGIYVYRLGDEHTPATPADGTPVPPSGWSEAPPTKANKGQYIWVSTVASLNEHTGVYSWTVPTIFSAGVIDGSVGPTGPAGDEGQRGTIKVSVPGSSWSNSIAYNAIRNSLGSDDKVLPWDTVVISNDGFAEMRYYTGGGNPGNWSVLQEFVDGDMIVNGTLGANKIAVNSITSNQIQTGGVNANVIQATSRMTIGSGNNVVIMDGTNSSGRIWAGNANPTSANFRVTPQGVLHCTNAIVSGKVDATDGVFDNVTINDTCTYNGTVTPNQISTDITSVLTKSNATRERRGSTGDTPLFGTVTVVARDYARTLVINVIQRVWAQRDSAGGAASSGSARIKATSSAYGTFWSPKVWAHSTSSTGSSPFEVITPVQIFIPIPANRAGVVNIHGHLDDISGRNIAGMTISGLNVDPAVVGTNGIWTAQLFKTGGDLS